MNKKIYLQPATDMVAVTIGNPLLTTSSGPGAGGETDDPNDLLSRRSGTGRHSIWDDDDNEE